MGSFDATCIISGLPIGDGDPVRLLLLTRSAHDPDGNDFVHGVGGRWQIRGPAVRATYDDYGSVDHVEDTLVARVAWVGLGKDCVELGVGDNQCHDVQVRPNMTQAQWLEALREGRVFVRDAPALRQLGGDGKWSVEEPGPGIPSFKKIEQTITDAGGKITATYGEDGFVLDEVAQGFFRVRTGGFGQDEKLAPLVPALVAAGFAAMVTCGTGNYPNSTEILVAPLPGTKDGSGARAHGFYSSGLGIMAGTGPTSPRPVSQALVREDVWALLRDTCNFAPDPDYEEEPTTLEQFKDLARAALKVVQDARKSGGETSAPGTLAKIMMRLDRLQHENVFYALLRSRAGTFGPDASLMLALDLDPTPDELDYFVCSLAETLYVQFAYSEVRGQWHPSTAGSQFGEWERHAALHSGLALIARGQCESDEE